MKELIKELRERSAYLIEIGINDSPLLFDKAADALEQLTSGDVELPEPEGFMDQSIGGDMAYTKYQLIDYGNRRAAQAVLDEREAQEIEPMHPQFIAGFKAGRYAGIRRLEASPETAPRPEIGSVTCRHCGESSVSFLVANPAQQVANQQVMTSWNAETDAHNTCALNIVAAIRKGE